MIRLCCAFGGASDEYEVSLESVYGVLCNVDKTKYEIICLGITKDGRWFLYEGPYDKIRDGSWAEDKENLTPAHLSLCRGDRAIYAGEKRLPIDVLFPVMHGTGCEDGTLQGALTLCDIPFVGSGCTASAVGMDKSITKAMVRGTGIPQADALVVYRYEIDKDIDKICEAVEAKFEYPVFVKPACTGSSVGVGKAKSSSGLRAALRDASRFDRKILVEEYIPGGEFECAVLGNENPQASCVGEIVPGSEFYDYNNKYSDDTAQYYIPARLPENISERIREYAVTIYRTLGCEGLARVDFFRHGDHVVFNEINTLPGFTPISMYPKLWIQSGVSYTELIDKLITLALEKI